MTATFRWHGTRAAPIAGGQVGVGVVGIAGRAVAVRGDTGPIIAVQQLATIGKQSGGGFGRPFIRLSVEVLWALASLGCLVK